MRSAPGTGSWLTPDDLKTKELLVVAYTGHFFGDDYVQPLDLGETLGLPVRCHFTSDRSLLEQADAVWFHAPSLSRFRRLPRKRRGQKWILASMESDVNYPILRNSRIVRRFDLSMSYRLDSDIPAPYPTWHEYGDFLTQPRPFETKVLTGAPLAYIASNPVHDRDRYVKAMMRHIPVDSYGRCLNNRSPDDFVDRANSWGAGVWESVRKTIRNYRFYLAFENSRTTDYVTERVFHALVEGTVPVYRGAPNICEFMPADDAVICADDFAGPAELAHHLHYLAERPEEYERHLAWKRRPLPERFKRLVDVASIDPRLRMAVKLAHNCGPECSCGGRLRLPPGR